MNTFYYKYVLYNIWDIFTLKIIVYLELKIIWMFWIPPLTPLRAHRERVGFNSPGPESTELSVRVQEAHSRMWHGAQTEERAVADGSHLLQRPSTHASGGAGFSLEDQSAVGILKWTLWISEVRVYLWIKGPTNEVKVENSTDFPCSLTFLPPFCM